MPRMFEFAVTSLVLLLSGYSVLKFAFFVLLPYDKRRSALDRAYAGKAFATALSDRILLGLAVLLALAIFASGGEPVSFLGGLFVGATLIQLFFHAFHAPMPSDREAPEPRSAIKNMSYAIQDRPSRAWKEMLSYGLIALLGLAVFCARHLRR